MVCDNSNCRFIAKWIRHDRELDILKYLNSVPLLNPRNHTIPITNILFGDDHTFIIMPQHTVLRDVSSLTQEAYYQLRYQVVEVGSWCSGYVQSPDTDYTGDCLLSRSGDRASRYQT